MLFPEKTPKLFLTKLNKESICILKTTPPVIEKKCNDEWTLEFNVYRYIDGELNESYDKIKDMKLVEAQSIGWFDIISCDEKTDEDGIEYKEVECKSLEDELTTKSVFDINGTFALYDISKPDKSLLHIIRDCCPSWRIGHIDNSLLGKYRTFSINSKKAYALLMDDISKSFECIFVFDTYTKEIHAYDFTTFGKQTNIIFTHKRLLLSSSIKFNKSEIKTVLRVVGGDDLDIRAVNPTGSNKIINVDNYKTIEFMSQGLIDAINTYESACESNKDYYTQQLNLLKTKQEEKQVLLTKVPSEKDSPTDWTKYGLNGLNAQKNTFESQQGIDVANGNSNPSSAHYNNYLAIWNKLQAVNLEISVREHQISLKDNEIDSVASELESINNTLNEDNYFTQRQKEELSQFLLEDDFIDETYVVSESDSDAEVIQIKNELYEAGLHQSEICSKPQYVVSVNSSNIYNLADYKNESDIKNLQLGDFVTVKFRDDYFSYARLLSAKIDYADKSKIELKFSNKSKLDEGMLQFGELLAEAKTNNTTLSLKGLGYDKARNQVNDVREFMNSNLNATTNQVVNGTNKEVVFGEYGLICREWLPNQNKYDKCEMRLNNNTMLFSDDNFRSSKTGIGKFTDGNGNTFYGFIGEAIVSNLVLSNALQIRNANSNFSITKDGFVATNGTNTITINPNNSSSLFAITKKSGNSTSNVLSFDSYGNGNFSGTITASSISGGSIYGSYISGAEISGSSFTAQNGNYTMLLNNSGLTFTNNSQSGDELSINSLNIGWRRSGSLLSSILKPELISTPELQVQSMKIVGTTSFVISNPSNASVKINDDNILTSGNYGTYFDSSGITGSYTSDNNIIFKGAHNAASVTYVQTYFSRTSHSHSSSEISGSYTSDNNIRFSGAYNGASVWYVQEYFERKSSSDFRLKCNIESLDDKFISVYNGFKPKTYNFKDNLFSDKKCNGLLAQEIMSNFSNNGLDWKDYDLIEEYETRDALTEGMYTGDTAYRVKYENLHAYHITFGQFLYREINALRNEILELKQINL